MSVATADVVYATRHGDVRLTLTVLATTAARGSLRQVTAVQ
ncbi:hypothetical protein [Deinococcus sonorensis]|uniref:Uncharacterized protein n=1 Tax=Deinococcus sonorensis TaxID=309891 RepID=A0ABV8Y8E6_9DEIO